MTRRHHRTQPVAPASPEPAPTATATERRGDEDLYAAARELTEDLLPRLHQLVPEKDTIIESQLGSTKRHAVAPIPWNSPAAMLFYEIHGNTRSYETLLTLRLFHTAKYRAGTDEQTHESLSRLPVLLAHARAEGLDPEMDMLKEMRGALVGWPRRVRALLDERRPDEEPEQKAPGDAKCPYCGDPLWLGPGWKTLEANATVLCRRCQDAEGKSLSWPVTERIGHLQRGELVTLPTAARRYGLNHGTLRKWRERGRLHPYGQDDHGNNLYRVSDVLTLAGQNDSEATA